MSPDVAAGAAWHVSSEVLRDWLIGNARQEDAWSVEAHLVACARCRATVAEGVVDTSLAALVRDVRGRLADLPAQAGVRPARRARRMSSLLGVRQLGLGSVLVVAVLLGGAAVLDLVSRWGDLAGGQGGAFDWFVAGGSWMAAIAPLLPVLGVVLSYGLGLDPSHELVATTPMAGLRLVLWRTAGVLGLALPAAFVVQAVVAQWRPQRLGDPNLIGWLLPALCLTLLTLAIGSFLGTGLAAGLVISGWVAGAVAPLMVGAAPVLLVEVPPAAWAMALAAAGAVVLLRRDRLGRLHHLSHQGGLA